MNINLNASTDNNYLFPVDNSGEGHTIEKKTEITLVCSFSDAPLAFWILAGENHNNNNINKLNKK